MPFTHQVNADLLLAPERIIAHGCNAQGVMGSGVAKAIKEKWPGAYKEYRQIYLDRGLTLGRNIHYHFRTDKKLIVNCITQKIDGS